MVGSDRARSSAVEVGLARWAIARPTPRSSHLGPALRDRPFFSLYPTLSTLLKLLFFIGFFGISANLDFDRVFCYN